MVAFSFYTNTKRLFVMKRSTSPEMIDCLHGIRVILTLWVIYGHTFYMYILVPVLNPVSTIDVSSIHCMQCLRDPRKIYWPFGQVRKFIFLSITISFQWIEHYHSMLALSAPIAVDSFFFLSGMLITVSVLKQLKKT